jgi:hypothetical protein
MSREEAERDRELLVLRVEVDRDLGPVADALRRAERDRAPGVVRFVLGEAHLIVREREGEGGAARRLLGELAGLDADDPVGRG